MSVSIKTSMITKGKNKTHKVCAKCGELKPISEFYRSVVIYDGLHSRCKKCEKECRLHIGGKQYANLHKRPFPLDDMCETCGKELKQYCYHHWDDINPSLGIYVCGACDFLAEGLDEIDRNSFKVDIYRILKREAEEVEKNYIYPGPFSPPNGVYRLFLDGKQTHKWCSHCGCMKSVKEFNRNGFDYDGLQTWCRECWRGYHIEYRDKRVSGLHKRPKPGCCEICGSNAKLDYHHWDGGNLSKGVWICGSWSNNRCHKLAEAVDLIDSGSLLPDKYSELKQKITLEEERNTCIEGSRK